MCYSAAECESSLPSITGCFFSDVSLIAEFTFCIVIEVNWYEN